MLSVICFKCGARKLEPFDPCRSCGAIPTTASDRTVSLALSTYIASETQLAQYKDEIARGVKPSIPMGALSKAIERVKSSFGTATGATSTSSRSGNCDFTTADQGPDQATDGMATRRSAWVWKAFGTSIDNVPFAVLGATPRDTRQRIVELAEDRSLEGDPAACQKARSDLTTPRIRLSAEIAWFPGLSPGKIAKCLGQLHDDAMSIRDESGLPPLAHFNLMTYALETVSDGDGDDTAAFICEIADLAEDVDVESVWRDINEDRDIAKLPPVQSAEQVEVALSEHKDRCRDVVTRVLNGLPSATLVHVLTTAVDTATDSGETPAPKLLDDLVDGYAATIQATLDTGTARIRKLVEAVKLSVGDGATPVDTKIAQLEVAIKKWDAIAQPIQLSAKARGIDHELSHDLANEIRSLAVDLFNSHDLLAQSQRITKLSQEVFAELPEVAETLDADAETLADISGKRRKSEAEQREWERQISYSADIGFIFKNKLSIGPAGVSWKGQRYPLESVSGVRWGGVRHSTNGVHTGTTYTIGFGDGRSSATVELKNESIYSAFTEKLWAAVCSRLVWELFAVMRTEGQLGHGDAQLQDDGMILMKHHLFEADQPTRCGWDDIHVWSRDGSFYVGHKADKKTYVELSYISDWNTHILEAAIRAAFKKGVNNLSDMLA